MNRRMEQPEVNGYIHVPFCAVKCGYCAFYSETGAPPDVVDAYLDRLEETVIPERLTTLYLGGGTPTLLSAGQLERLIAILDGKFTFAPGAERSVEANPETLDADKIALLRSFFTRISLGVQSFDAALRRKIGRRCSDEVLGRALDLVCGAGFPHWNCDLIYSLPDETLSQWKADLRRVGRCGADHVSCYSLTPERSAALGGRFTVDDRAEAAMYRMAEEVLCEYGIRRYEISNYAAPGAECRHNVNVWRGGILRGYGPSAADFDGEDRHIQVESLSKWLAGVAPECDRISREKRLNEIFAVNLRTTEGWSAGSWRQVPHADEWGDRQRIAALSAGKFPGCWHISDDRVRLSAHGMMFWNDIAADLL